MFGKSLESNNIEIKRPAVNPSRQPPLPQVSLPGNQPAIEGNEERLLDA